MSDIGTTTSKGFYLTPARIGDFIRKSDLGLAIGIMAILVVLILPLPTWLLDVSLAFSLSFSILILMTAVFIRKPLEFSSFPTILLITNFVVITKGSGRIAEVAARFSLDAMPGKQMAIDADLSAGLIDEKEAKSRRKDLEDESNFFGAMDGASKFVRGD